MSLEQAEKLIEKGYTVIPVWPASKDGLTCLCPRGRTCPSVGKHPMGDEWQSQAGGLEAIQAASEKVKKDVNLGILVDRYSEVRDGKTYRLVVVDIDPRNGGNQDMQAYLKTNPQLPPTRVVGTGSQGWHYYFLAEEGTSLRGKYGHGVDIKSNGMVIAEGSRSGSGEYNLITDEPLALMPEPLLNAVKREVAEYPSDDYVSVTPDDPDFPRRKNYCTKALEAIYADIDALAKAKTENPEDYKGDPWNQTLYNSAVSAHELANTPEAQVSHDEVDSELAKRMPRDKNFTDEVVSRTLASAKSKAGNQLRAIPKPSGVPTLGPVPTASAGAGGGNTPPPKATAYQRHMDNNRTWTDADVADTFAETFEGEVMHVNGLGWHVWDGRSFQESHDNVVHAISKSMAQDMTAAAALAGDDNGVKEGRKRMQSRAIKACADLASGLPGIQVAAGSLDADMHLLNTPAGIVDLRDGTLSPHDPMARMTKLTRAPYVPGARHADVDTALEALPEDVRDYMQVRLGQSLIGNTPSDDRLAVLHGGGSNGKSALMDGLMQAVGQYGVVLSERVIIAAEGAHPTELTDLRGARMGFLEELPSTGSLNAKRVKNLVGTDRMTARKTHRDSITWRATHTVFLTSNHRPRIADTDHGVWRRMLLVDFPYRYVERPDELKNGSNRRLGDPGLRGRLKFGAAQQEALLAWLVEGAMRYYAANETMPEVPASVARDTEEWRHGQNPLDQFLQEMVEPEDGYCIAGTDLFVEYTSWLATNGHAKWSDQLLAERMRASELVASWGATKKPTNITNGESDKMTKISYRPGSPAISRAYEEGSKVNAWRGIRWKAPTVVPQGLRAVNE